MVHHYSDSDLPSPRSFPTIVPTIAEEKEALNKKRKRDRKNQTTSQQHLRPNNSYSRIKLVRKNSS
jgi:hypothetical protein